MSRRHRTYAAGRTSCCCATRSKRRTEAVSAAAGDARNTRRATLGRKSSLATMVPDPAVEAGARDACSRRYGRGHRESVPCPGSEGRGAPDEVLVERAGSAVNVAPDQIHIRGFDIGWRKHNALQQRRVEIRQLTREPCLDPVCVALAHGFGPRAFGDLDLSRGIALRPRRDLLKLDPQNPASVGELARRLARPAGRRRSSLRLEAGCARLHSQREKPHRARASGG